MGLPRIKFVILILKLQPGNETSVVVSHACVMRVLYMCYACAVHVLYMCCACAMRVLCMCCTCAVHVLCVCCACAVHVDMYVSICLDRSAMYRCIAVCGRTCNDQRTVLYVRLVTSSAYSLYLGWCWHPKTLHSSKS